MTLTTFEAYIGRQSPGGAELRNLKDDAGASNLLSTGVSDKDQYRDHVRVWVYSVTNIKTRLCNWLKKWEP